MDWRMPCHEFQTSRLPWIPEHDIGSFPGGVSRLKLSPWGRGVLLQVLVKINSAKHNWNFNFSWLPELRPASGQTCLLSGSQGINRNGGSSSSWRSSTGGFLQFPGILEPSWNLEDLEVAIIRFIDSDTHIVHQLVGVHNDGFARCIYTHAELLVSRIGIHSDLVNAILLDGRKIPEHTVEPHFHFHCLARVVHNLCRTHTWSFVLATSRRSLQATDLLLSFRLPEAPSQQREITKKHRSLWNG